MNTGKFNQELESLINEAKESGMSDEQITRLLAQQITVFGSQNSGHNSDNHATWISIQQSSLAIKSLLQ